MCTCSSSSVLWIGSTALITQYSQWMHRLVYTHHNKLHSPPSHLPHQVLLSVCLRVCSHSLLQHRFLFITFHYAFLKGRHSVTASQHTHILYTTTHPSKCVITRMLSTIQHLRWENNCYTCIMLLFMPFNMCSGPKQILVVDISENILTCINIPLISHLQKYSDCELTGANIILI